MKPWHSIAIAFVGLLGSWVIRLWIGTLRFRFVLDDPASNPAVSPRRGLYMFWHEALLLPAYTHARRGFSILVSKHRDGELITQAVRMLGGVAVRGSTRRGGVAALLRMMRQRDRRHLAITPDGPRGPRRVVQLGAVFLASRGRMPLVPVGFAAADCWRAPSWDRMVLPRPGCQARCVLGRAIDVPPDADRRQLEASRCRAQAALDEVQTRAERLAGADDSQASLMTLQQLIGE